MNWKEARADEIIGICMVVVLIELLIFAIGFQLGVWFIKKEPLNKQVSVFLVDKVTGKSVSVGSVMIKDDTQSIAVEVTLPEEKVFIPEEKKDIKEE